MRVGYTIYDKEKTIKLTSAPENGWNIVFEGFDIIKPMFDYVLVEKDEEKTKTAGGLVIPDTMKEKPSTGTIVAVGDGLICEKTGESIPMKVKVGDRIIFPKLAGKTIKVGEFEKTILKQSEILGILN